jgi:hypothetical protein
VSDDADLEVWTAERHLKPFERILQKPVRLEVAAAPAKPVRRAKSRRATPQVAPVGRRAGFRVNP